MLILRLMVHYMVVLPPPSPPLRRPRFTRLSRRPRIRRLFNGALLGLLLLACLLGAYACASQRALRREVRDTPRDPATGVVLGTEALALDPPGRADAPTTACLLVHGFIGSRKDFADLGPRLAAAGFHVDIMRLPGHGTTPQDFRAQSPESLLQAVIDEYRALRRQYRAVYVVGFSMGGALSTLLASRENVDRLVLAAPYYGVTYKWYYLLPPSLWNTLLGPAVPYGIKYDCFIKLNRREALGEIFTYRCVPTRGVSTLLALGRQARQPQTLQAVKCPVLVISSVGDEAASPDRVREAFPLLASPRKQAHWLTARSNHQVFWDYDREEVKTAVVDFLKQ